MVLDGIGPAAPEDTPQLCHASLKLVKLLVDSITQVLHGGGGQVGVHLPEVL